MAKKLQMKRGTAADWLKAKDHILVEGEIGVEIDTHKIKVGDGKTTYEKLPYAGGGAIEWEDF